MRTFILAVLLAVGLGLSGTGSTSAFTPGLRSAVHVKMPDGHCSGTVVGTRTILTATHCFSPGSTVQEIDGRRVTVLKRRDDGSDHTLIWLAHPVGKPKALLHGRMPAPGSQVYLWGNPLTLRTQLRVGYVTGVIGPAATLGTDIRADSALVDMNSWNGDSGGGIFDMQGRLVGVVYGAYGQTGRVGGFKLLIAQPIAFSASTLQEIE